MNMGKFINTLSDAILDIQTEKKQLLKYIHSLHLSQEHKILDVGCGFGRNLKLLREGGFDVIGVDINQTIVDSNINSGLTCISDQQFKQTTDLYDVVLMFHIIEHFNPDAVIKFLDYYLDRLKLGGHLIIATPLLTSYFHEDFDHVKPYYPTGIEMVFGLKEAQVQYYSKNKLSLVDIWFRKWPFVLKHYSGLYVTKRNSRLLVKLNVLLALMFRMTFGLVGKKNGWMGLYKKELGSNVHHECLSQGSKPYSEISFEPNTCILK